MRYRDRLGDLNSMSAFQLISDGFADSMASQAIQTEMTGTETKVTFAKPDVKHEAEKTPTDFFRDGYDLADKVRRAEALRVQIEREKRAQASQKAAEEAARREQAEILKMALGYE